ncbi:MAG: 23S rRNA (uracil(1939)-C(5))-methyltransferase RlmD [Solirubrobacterales bacterium]|nr:23S rRNA (uracil(1939)-C(5))-methyltransferase RlmD [Solirubrobacterales bacterium]MBV9167593.1 23S rRNA (uracil(1939)-C(5))-methyltransferase RlmD [Solirubrobacterales bacterium]
MHQTTTARPRTGAELELTVDSLAYGGAGVARHNSYVVFVDGAVPGDRVRAHLYKTKRSYGNARVVEILEPGPDRVERVADHPGAPWQILAYERQLEAKQLQVEEALRRIGSLEGFALEPIVPAVEQWRYRNKVEFSFGGGHGDLLCGFHVPGRWDEIVDVPDTLLASAAINAVRERLVGWCRGQRLAPYDRRTGDGFLRNLVVREGRRTGDLQARLVTCPGDLDREGLARAAGDLTGVLWTRTSALAEVSQGGETEIVAGSEWIEEELGGMRFRVSPEAFFQTNTEMAERLYETAVQYAQPGGFERIYDLYCGIGSIGLLMAPRAGEVWGLELVEGAVRDAIANARSNEVDNARFLAGDIRLTLRGLLEQAGAPDVLVVDPPRAGLSQKVVRRIVEATPRRIVYVSCNPTTLAPNAAQLVQAGYALERVRPVDVFPQTPHIECVALLQRSSR